MKTKMEIFEEIAKKHLRFNSLKVKNSDREDFKEVHVQSLIEAFNEVWIMAQKEAQKKADEEMNFAVGKFYW
jgi:hypothetical protein